MRTRMTHPNRAGAQLLAALLAAFGAAFAAANTAIQYQIDHRWSTAVTVFAAVTVALTAAVAGLWWDRHRHVTRHHPSWWAPARRPIPATPETLARFWEFVAFIQGLDAAARVGLKHQADAWNTDPDAVQDAWDAVDQAVVDAGRLVPYDDGPGTTTLTAIGQLEDLAPGTDAIALVILATGLDIDPDHVKTLTGWWPTTTAVPAPAA